MQYLAVQLLNFNEKILVMKNELVIAFMEHRPQSPVGATVKPDMLTAVQNEIKCLQATVENLRESLQRSHVDFESALSLAEKCSSLPEQEAKAAFDRFVSETTYESTTEAFANKHHDIGVDACIEELNRCYEVALRENGDIDDANNIEVLIDHLQQLRKQQN